MNDPTDVVDRYLRDTFASDADAAPAPYDLLETAVRRGRARRRRTAVAGALASFVVVMAGVAAVQQLPTRAATPPSASSFPSQPSQPNPPLVTTTPALLFRGVAVPVPAAYLDPARMRCGQPVADAAYVLGDGQAYETCAVPPVAGLTEVVMQDITNISDVDSAAGTHVLADGRTQIASAVPGDGIWLTVTSPDPARAQQLFDGTLVVEAWEGCDVRVGTVPEDSHGSLPAPDRSTSLGRLCGYRNGWLVSTKLLQTGGIIAVADLITSTRSDATLDCATGPSTTTGWWVTLGAERYWVPNGGCPRLLGENGGAASVSEELRAQLTQLAPGAWTS